MCKQAAHLDRFWRILGLCGNEKFEGQTNKQTRWLELEKRTNRKSGLTWEEIFFEVISEVILVVSYTLSTSFSMFLNLPFWDLYHTLFITGVTSDVVEVQGEDPGTPSCLRYVDTRNTPGHQRIPKYQVNKTKEHTHSDWSVGRGCTQNLSIICPCREKVSVRVVSSTDRRNDVFRKGIQNWHV